MISVEEILIKVSGVFYMSYWKVQGSILEF